MLPATVNIRAGEPASDEQRIELRSLIRTRATAAGWRKWLYDRVDAAGDLTCGAAVDGLFYARACAPKDAVPDRSTPEQAAALRELIRTHRVPGPLATAFRNRAKTGALTYIEADQWLVEWMRLPPKTFIVASDLPRQSGWTAPDGYYALTHADGMPRCFRVHTLPASGRRIVEQITGDNRSQRRKLVGYPATEVLQTIAADPPAAALLYARTRHRCARCNQPIEQRPGEPGYDNGYGRDCWDIINAENAATAS